MIAVPCVGAEPIRPRVTAHMTVDELFAAAGLSPVGPFFGAKAAANAGPAFTWLSSTARSSISVAQNTRFRVVSANAIGISFSGALVHFRAYYRNPYERDNKRELPGLPFEGSYAGR